MRFRVRAQRAAKVFHAGGFMPLISRRTWRAACVSMLATAAAAAAAEPLTLEIAVERTLASNPDLRSYAFRSRAQQARTDAAALRPPFELHAEVQDALGTGRTSGFDTAETTVSLSQVIELGAKRERRVDAAAAGSGLIDAERAAAELDVLTEVTRRFIHVAADQEHLELTRRTASLATETVDAATARVGAARAPDVELRRARVALARAGVDREHAEHELASSRRKLAAMWGAANLEYDSVDANLYALPEPGSFEDLVARLAGSPDFLRFASEARLRDAEIRLAETQARSSLTVTTGLKRLEVTNDTALVLGVTVPLKAAARSRGAIAEATALRAETDAEREAQRVHAEAQLFELYQELRHAITEAGVLRGEMLPEMEAALAGTRDAFERGRYSYLEWVDAQRELTEVQRALIESSANAHLFRAEIERLTGEPLDAGRRGTNP
jgi:outer membrane protein, heavy metal efflux system